MNLDSEPILDCYITPGILAVIVVVVVTSVVIAYFIATACVRACDNKSPTYMYCARCNQFIGSHNVVLPPHTLPGLLYDDPNPMALIKHNTFQSFHDVPDVRVDVSDHNTNPPTGSGTFQRLGTNPPTGAGTFQRLGMRLSRSNRSTTFANLETRALSPIQNSPPDKRSATSGMELLTPTPNLTNHVNESRALPSSVKTSRRSTPNDPSTKRAVITTPRQSAGKAGPRLTGASSKSLQTVNRIMHSHSQGDQDSDCLSEADSVFYEDRSVRGDSSHRREFSKLSQVRILASPPPSGDSSRHPGALITKTPANANKSHRKSQAKSCEPQVSGRNQMTNLNSNFIRSKVRDSVRSQGSGKSRRSLMSRKLELVSEDKRSKNSKVTRYDPLINQNPTTTQESCVSEEDQPLLNSHLKTNTGATMKGVITYRKVTEEGKDANGDENGPGENTSQVYTHNNLRENTEGKNTGIEAINTGIRGSPDNTLNQMPIPLVQIDIGDPPASVSTDHLICESCSLGTCRSHKVNDGTSKVKSDAIGESGKHDNIHKELSIDGHMTRSTPPPFGQKFETKSKVRTSSSARKENAKYLGKWPGFSESDITSQSEDERPRSRLLSLRTNHLAGLSQSEEDETTRNIQKQRDSYHTSETPSQSPSYPVQTSKYVTTKRGTPTPLSLPICTPKFVTVRQKNDDQNASNYPPNSWDSKQEFVDHHSPNFPPNSWDPINNQQFQTNLPLNLSASSGQVNLSRSSCINNNLSVTASAMDNSTPAEGNHTSSPHSSVHVFKPGDLSIPGFDVSLQLSPNQDMVDCERSKLPILIESSPPLIQDGRYRHPLNNTMRLPLPSPNSVENASSKLDSETSDTLPHVTQAGDTENLSSPYDIRWPGGKPRLADNSTGSVSSQNQKFRLNQESSRGASFDSTSTLVPSPANPQTPDVFQPVPSPQHSRIPRLKDRIQQVRSMPPVTQWSRVKEHALPPSLPPPAPKTRIEGLGSPSYLPADSPGKCGNKADSNLEQEVRPSPTASPWSRVKEHSLPPQPHGPRVMDHFPPPSLPPPPLPHSNRTRIKEQSFSSSTPPPNLSMLPPRHSLGSFSPSTPPPALSSHTPLPHSHMSRINQHYFSPSTPPPNLSMPPPPPRSFSPSTPRPNLSMLPPPQLSKENKHIFPHPLPPHASSMPPAPQWSRVKEHALPPSLPPPAPKTRILSSSQSSYQPTEISNTPWGNGEKPKAVNSLVDVCRENGSDVQEVPPTPHRSRVKDHAIPPLTPTRISSLGPRSHLLTDTPKTRISGSSVPDDGRESGPLVGVPVPGYSSLEDQHGGCRPDEILGTPGRSNTNPSIRQIRTRSTTESSHPPSLAWDSYGSEEPTFIPRMEMDLDDYTLSTASESEVNNINMVYRSDGDSRSNRDSMGRVAVGNERNYQSSSQEREGEFQASKYVRSGVRTRSQSQLED